VPPKRGGGNARFAFSPDRGSTCPCGALKGSGWRDLAIAATSAILRAMPRKLKILPLMALVVIAVAIEFIQRGNLTDPMPFPFTVVGAAGGVFVGYLAAREIACAMPDKKPFQSVMSILSFPLLGLFAGTLLARSLFLQAAFLNVSTTPQMTLVHVESRQTSGRRKSWFGSKNYWVNVSLAEQGRTFRVLVDFALYETIGPKAAPGTHCLLLPVERGRWSVRRVNAPNHFDRPLGLEDYRRC
jgi:hypothetical protein